MSAKCVSQLPSDLTDVREDTRVLQWWTIESLAGDAGRGRSDAKSEARAVDVGRGYLRDADRVLARERNVGRWQVFVYVCTTFLVCNPQDERSPVIGGAVGVGEDRIVPPVDERSCRMDSLRRQLSQQWLEGRS